MTLDGGKTAIETNPLAATRSEAVRALANQIDVVDGKGKMTLALAGKMSIWLTVDKDHSDAIKVQGELRKFYSEYQAEWWRVLRITTVNKQLFLNNEEALMLSVYLDRNTEIERKMRSLGAMGFSL